MLNGTRGKKQVWRPHVRTWAFCKHVYRTAAESACDIVGTFGAPRSDSLPGEYYPSSLRPWDRQKNAYERPKANEMILCKSTRQM